MSNNIGVWIDHRRAVVVSIANGGESIKVIESEVERHARLHGGSRSKDPTGPQDVVKESQRDDRYRHHLETFYDEVQRAVADAEGILILGPGEAKGELEKHLRKTKALQALIAAVEPADKLTDHQLAARVRDFFAKPVASK